LNVLGIQLMLDLNDCNRDLLDDLQYIKEAMLQVAHQIGAHVIGESFHQFQPQGVTGVLAIAESHICIHTWPEYGYAAADIFTCGTSFEPRRAAQILVEKLESKDHFLTEVKRGIMSEQVVSP